MYKNLVVYHADCVDGFASAWVASKYLPKESTEYLPFKYEDSIEPILEKLKNEKTGLIILDFSFSPEQMKQLRAAAIALVWIDHHESSLRNHFPFALPAGKYKEISEDAFIVIDTYACGAVLTFRHSVSKGTVVPKILQYVDDYDRWKFELPGTKEFHAAIRFREPWTFEQWDALEHKTAELIEEGKLLLEKHRHDVETARKNAVKIVIPGTQWEPITGLAVNAPANLASDLGNKLAKECGTFGFVWYMNSKGKIKVSLRSIGSFNVAVLAEPFGGGGHKNAAGFVCAPGDLFAMIHRGVSAVLSEAEEEGRPA